MFLRAPAEFPWDGPYITEKAMKRKCALWLWAFLFLLFSCEELDRNNPLDPKNPRSESRRMILVEAFVNDATPFSSYALSAVDSLAATFSSDQIIIAEHHLPSANFTDMNALPESADRYQGLAPADPAVPDLFFNGAKVRMQGASSAHAASQRYRGGLHHELGGITHFTIAARKNIAASEIQIDATIARLGDSGFPQIAVFALVWEDLGVAGHHHLVRKIFSPEVFSGIAAGETKTVRFAAVLPPRVRDTARLQAAVVIEHDADFGTEVLQAALAE